MYAVSIGSFVLWSLASHHTESLNHLTYLLLLACISFCFGRFHLLVLLARVLSVLLLACISFEPFPLLCTCSSRVTSVAVPSPQGIGQVLVSEPALNMMMRDQYANYVVQRMVECAPVPLQHRLFEIIDGQRESLR